MGTARSWFNLQQRIDSVSYTHLDVYKRQSTDSRIYWYDLYGLFTYTRYLPFSKMDWLVCGRIMYLLEIVYSLLQIESATCCSHYLHSNNIWDSDIQSWLSILSVLLYSCIEVSHNDQHVMPNNLATHVIKSAIKVSFSVTYFSYVVVCADITVTFYTCLLYTSRCV